MMSTSVVIAILVCCCTSLNYGCAFTTSSLRSSRAFSRGSSRRTVFFSTVTPVDEAATAVVEDATSSTSSSAAVPAVPASSPSPAVNWSSRQHLYGVDMILDEENDSNNNNNNNKASTTKTTTVASFTLDANGDEQTAASAASSSSSSAALPLPQTYVTCGKCSSLFAIAASDLGNSQYTKGCRVKCSVCDHTWYQSRERLFDIPLQTHDMMPANKADLDRISRNIGYGQAPNYIGVYKLYVGNLDFSTTSDQLLHFIESNIVGQVGQEDAEGGGGSDGRNQVCDVSLVKGHDGRPRGFAFVTFYYEEDGKRALINCNGKECNGRELMVKEPNK